MTGHRTALRGWEQASAIYLKTPPSSCYDPFGSIYSWINIAEHIRMAPTWYPILLYKLLAGDIRAILAYLDVPSGGEGVWIFCMRCVCAKKSDTATPSNDTRDPCTAPSTLGTPPPPPPPHYQLPSSLSILYPLPKYHRAMSADAIETVSSFILDAPPGEVLPPSPTPTAG